MEINTNDIIVIGIMTGTSLDGIDTAVCRFSFDGSRFGYQELFFKTYKYPEKLRLKISEILSDTVQLFDISQLNFALSKVYADAVNNALIELGTERNEVAAIGLHGQTIYHQPQVMNFCGMPIASTLQAGNISALNQLTGIPVIGDFRSADIALGGQGAPLVPVFDYEFLRSDSENIIALNIGGMANITLLPQNCKREQVIAFDTGPGNILIDIAARRYFNVEYDSGGGFARAGNPDYNLLDKMMEHPYIHKTFPKSTGRELFNIQFFKNYFEDYSNGGDAVSTLTHFTAKSIAVNIQNSGFDADRLVVSGGGGRNIFLMELISHYLPGIKVQTSESQGIGIDSKEAVCFAFLAYLNILRLPGNIPSATGAKSQTILGVRAG